MTAALTLRPEQRELLTQALADAVYYRDPPADCQSCDALDDEAKLCAECAGTLARARAYLALGRDLVVPISA